MIDWYFYAVARHRYDVYGGGHEDQAWAGIYPARRLLRDAADAVAGRPAIANLVPKLTSKTGDRDNDQVRRHVWDRDRVKLSAGRGGNGAWVSGRR